MFSIRIIYLYIKRIRNVILYIKVLKGLKILKIYRNLTYIKMIYNCRVKFEIRELSFDILKLVFRLWENI